MNYIAERNNGKEKLSFQIVRKNDLYKGNFEYANNTEDNYFQFTSVTFTGKTEWNIVNAMLCNANNFLFDLQVPDYKELTESIWSSFFELHQPELFTN